MTTQQLTLRDHLHSRSLSAQFTHARSDANTKFAIERDYALSIIQGNVKLHNCIPDTVGRCILDVASLGISLSPVKREAYLIPYNVKGDTICTLSISYMGMEQIAYRTGMVKNIQTNVAREGDTIRVFTENNRRYVQHEESMVARGKVTHAYCIATYPDGDTHVEVMDREQIMAVRGAAAKKNNGNIPFTWMQTNPFRYEMYKKAVLRRGWKHWPKSGIEGSDKIASIIERQDPVDFTPTAPVKESPGDTTMTITDDQINELRELMEEGGIKHAVHDRWLIGMAKALGYQSVEAIKYDDYEQAKTNMINGISKYVERTQASNPQGEGQ